MLPERLLNRPPRAASSGARLQQIRPPVARAAQEHLLLLQALQLLVVKAGRAALVGGKLVGHGG